jgi:prepilin-type N-terminal cleavage/methylation domain-containing protein
MWHKKAFTLIEMIVSIVIFMLSLLALYSAYEMFYRTSKQEIARTITSDKLRLAMEQLERFISDAGIGISNNYLEGSTVTNWNREYRENTIPDNDNRTLTNPRQATNGNLAAFAVTLDNGNNIEEITPSSYANLIQIHIKSIIGEYPYSGNYAVFDSERFNNNNILKTALNLPESEINFTTIVMDLSKNLITSVCDNGLCKGQLPNINMLNNGNIIFVAKKTANNLNDYFYFKTIRLSSTNNENNEKYAYCNGNTRNLIVQRGNERGGQPLIPCVAYFNADFGCYDNKRIKWQRKVCSKIKNLKLVRIGLIVQNGFIDKNLIYHEGDTLEFPSLGRTESPNNASAVKYTIKSNNNIKNDMRYYKWEIIERIIATPNLNY